MAQWTVMDYTQIVLDRDTDTPLYEQLASALLAAVECGDLTVGARLPAERDLASTLGLSRTTVATAYRELEARGLLRSHVGRGTFVCASMEPPEAPFAWRGKVARGAQRVRDATLGNFVRWSAAPDLISFAAGGPAPECFPLAEFQRITARVLETEAGAALGHGPVEGQPRLRQALASRFGVRQEQVLVLTGSQQGLDLIARCLLDPGDTVVMDRPGYLGAIQVFRSAGANVVGWDVTRADLDELEDLVLRHRPKLIYTNPTFQNPTGRTFSVRERRELLELAARYRLPVVEDEPYRDLYFSEPPPPALYHLDSHQIVIHLGTFSKMFAPGLRLGWLAASEAIVDQLAIVKQRADVYSAGLNQFVAAECLSRGIVQQHIIELRQEHARRQEAMVHALGAHLPPRTLSFTRPQGGLYLWCRLSPKTEARMVLQESMPLGLAFAAGDLFYPDGGGAHELRLCFSTSTPARIDEGARRLSVALRPLLDRPAGQPLPSLPVV
jgi:2-aminoadipate transaminase